MLKIAIVDSGISKEAKNIKQVKAQYTVIEKNGELAILEQSAEDQIGHGTAVFSIISRLVPEAEITIVKVFEEEDNISSARLVYALEFINKELTCDVVNISAGIEIVEQYEALEAVCKEIQAKGTNIVAAFSNDGGIAYPAALEDVIGVDRMNMYKKRGEFAYINSNIINLVFSDVFYRVEWLNNQKTLIKGISFATAYASGIIGKFLVKNPMATKIQIHSYLKESAKQVIGEQEEEYIFKPQFNIKKAIVFPYNKETHSLLRYSDYLGFEIAGVYDERLKGLVGTTQYDRVVQAYENINWEEDFDTVILGCCDELSGLTNKNYKDEILQCCKKHHKNIYAFERTAETSKSLYYPQIGSKDIPKNRFNKLRRLNTPVVAVCGTSSQQGKFSLQLEMKKQMEKLDYKVGHISTEPSGYLFGADFVFPMGYNATVDRNVDLHDYIRLLNEQLWEIERQKAEIIIVGNQSGSTQYDTNNLQLYTLEQHAFLLGTLPDRFVLCVNPHDSMDYIERTINYLNAVNSGKVFSLVIYPIETKLTQNGISFVKEKISSIQKEEFRKRLRERFKLPVFVMGVETEVEALCECMIDEFCE